MRLRQAVIVARELEPAVAALRSELGLGEPFRDPGVGAFGLANAVFSIGDCFLEIVSPVREGTTAGRYLERSGGPGGYMVIFDLRELAGARARAAERGVRAVWQIDLPDISTTHLHPRDIGGAIVSIDSSRPYGSWRWGGPQWTEPAAAPPAGALVGVTLAVHDPPAVAALWAHVLGALAPEPGAEPSIELEGSWVRFEPTSADRPERLVEIAVEAPPSARAPDAAAPHSFELLGVRWRSLPVAAPVNAQ